MKKSCRNINIRNEDVIRPYVENCIHRHYKRYDFKRLILSHGMSEDDYNICTLTCNKSLLNDVITSISHECAMAITNRKIELEPVRIRVKYDTTTGKQRLIGKESAIQQVYDYIAVYSAMDIFKRRMVTEQASSIPRRGQIYGVRMIRRWIRDDNKSVRYAVNHEKRYTRKCRFFVKLDIQKCYPSANKDIFMRLFSKDCGNDDIVWLWDTLLTSHHVDGYTGLMIGALPSQWACQYMLSFAYRYAKSIFKSRRGKHILAVQHMCLFMDDMLLMGSNRNQLKRAVDMLIMYVRDELGWTIKPEYHIRELDKFSIDMMGFVIHSDGAVTIRSRNFIHMRRMVLRHERDGKPFTITQARRMTSYKGFVDYSCSQRITERYHLCNAFREASHTISRYDRKKVKA